MMQYRERDAVTKYLWDHYRHLMTVSEIKVAKALRAREKARASSSPRIAQLINERWGFMGDPEVEAALANGHAAFRHRVAERLLKEHGDAIFINRCPHCERVTRFPEARYCYWCNNMWGKRREA